MLVLIGSLFCASILMPPITAMLGRTIPTAILTAILALLAGFCSISMAFNRSISIWQWCQCELVLLAFLLAIGFLVLLLMRLGCGGVAAAAIVTLLVVAWISAPVWLSAPLEGYRLHYSVALHPLFVINGIVPQLGIWTEQQVAYSLTSIGQDVQYDLPASPWLFVGVYGIVGVFGGVVTWKNQKFQI